MVGYVQVVVSGFDSVVCLTSFFSNHCMCAIFHLHICEGQLGKGKVAWVSLAVGMAHQSHPEAAMPSILL